MERAVEVRRKSNAFIIYDRKLPVLTRHILIKHRNTMLTRSLLALRYLRNRAAECAP